MPKIKPMVLAAVLLGTVLPGTALADITYTMPADGWVYIGRLNDEIYLAYSDTGEQCTLKRLSTVAWLVEHVRINGSQGNDFIAVAAYSSFNVCGHTLGPIPFGTNGKTLTIDGKGGADIIHGGLITGLLYGGGGGDFLRTDHPETAFIFGGSGNDHISTSSFAGYLFGESGNDTVCVLNEQRIAFVLDGGTHAISPPGGDRRCGDTPLGTTGFESTGCAGYCF